MKKIFLTTGFCCLLYASAVAQVASYKNSIRIGADIMSRGGTDDFVPVIRYARHVVNDRIVLAGSAGYHKDKNTLYASDLGYDVSFGARPRQRFMFDATASFDLIRSPRHAFRLGGGPSAWFRKDEVATGTTPVYSNGGRLIGIYIVRDRTEEINIGYNLAAEYEYTFGSRVTLGIRANRVDINKVGVSSGAGMNIGYRF
jgi:hypothetical protein